MEMDSSDFGDTRFSSGRTAINEIGARFGPEILPSIEISGKRGEKKTRDGKRRKIEEGRKWVGV